MVELYGVYLSQLPNKLALAELIDEQFYNAWKKRYRNIRDDRIMRPSLGGLYLLQSSQARGSLLYDAKGRPFFTDSDMDFNITHTDQIVFCAVERTPSGVGARAAGTPPFLFEGECRVGIDCESVSHIRHVRICPLAERWFTARELDLFLTSPTDENFLRIWTRKEALVKWLGDGLKKMRKADTTAAGAELGVCFHEYRVGDTLVTLCSHLEAQVPDKICMLSVEDVFL